MNLTFHFVAYYPHPGGIEFTLRCPWDIDAEFDRAALIQLIEYVESLWPGCRKGYCVYQMNEKDDVLRGWGLQAWENRVAWKMQSHPPFVQGTPPTA